MKKIITLMMMALLFTLKAIASVDIPTEYYSTVGEGTFAFYDVENKQFITSGDNADTPEFLTLTQDVDDKYFCQFENGSYWRFSYTWEYPRLFKDATEETRTSFAFEGNYAEGYLIATGNGHYYGQDVGGDWGQTTAVAERMHHVALISESNYKAYDKKQSQSLLHKKFHSTVAARTFAIYDLVDKKFFVHPGWSGLALGDEPLFFTFKESGTGYYIQVDANNSGSYLKIDGVDYPAIWNDGDESNRTVWNFTDDNATDGDNTYYMYGLDNAKSDGSTRYYGNDGWLAAESGNSWAWHKVALISETDYAKWQNNDGTLDVVVTDAGYATLYYADGALEVPEGVKAYTVHEKSATKVELVAVDGTIPAGEPVLLEAAEGTYVFTVTTAATVAKDADNRLRGADADGNMTAESGVNFYKFAKDTQTGVGFYLGVADGSAFNVGSTGKKYNKAYLTLPKSAGASIRLFGDDDDMATGIKAVEGKAQQAVRHNLAGRRVDASYKGIVIVGGKKVMSK